MVITGHDDGHIRTSAPLKCSANVNPTATYTWIDESNGNTINGSTINITHSGKYTCNASNIIRGQFHQHSKSITLQGKSHVSSSLSSDVCTPERRNLGPLNQIVI